MKIALISNSASGLINFRRELIKDIREQKHIIFGFAPDFSSQQARELAQLGAVPIKYTLFRTGINPVSELISILSLLSALKNENPDIIFCFQIKPAIYGSLAAKIIGIDNVFIMIEGLGYVFTEEKIRAKLLRRLVITLFRIAFKKAKKVFFLNEDDRNELIKLKIISPNKSVILGGIGVDLSEWSYSEPRLSEISFVFVGRLLREKGIVEYLEAAKWIKSRYPEIKFYVLGSVDSNPGAISGKVISSYAAKGIIEWPGFVDVKPWLQKSSVFVLPSYREGIPRSTQEAMAIGRPIITTSAPGCRDTVIDGLNGYLIPPRNVNALVAAMVKFIENPGLVKTMGVESRRLAEKKLNAKEKNKIIIKEIFGA